MIRSLQSLPVPILPLFSGTNWPPKDANHLGDERDRIDGGNKTKIIVIDDEALIAETVVEILNGEGFEAMPVSSGAAAVELAKVVRPAVILSDVIMPGMNGIETGIKIRQIVPNCKIILFSGQAATVDLLEQARRQGHRFDILAKPIRPENLISLIRSSIPTQ
jgi:CheY-like chemotaxis protein